MECVVRVRMMKGEESRGKVQNVTEALPHGRSQMPKEQSSGEPWRREPTEGERGE